MSVRRVTARSIEISTAEEQRVIVPAGQTWSHAREFAVAQVTETLEEDDAGAPVYTIKVSGPALTPLSRLHRTQTAERYWAGTGWLSALASGGRRYLHEIVREPAELPAAVKELLLGDAALRLWSCPDQAQG